MNSNELVGNPYLSTDQGRDPCAKRVTEGLPTVANDSKKGRSYRLAERFEGTLKA